jgi:hypothetical protein
MYAAVQQYEPRRRHFEQTESNVIEADKYDALRDYLKARTETELVLSFEEIEGILGFALSRSSQRARWWEKERNPQDAMPQRNAIRDGGYEGTRLSDGTGVRFRRIGAKFYRR